MTFSFEGIKPAIVNNLESEKKRVPNELERALEKYPISHLLKELATLTSEDRELLNRELNMAGESFHIFGSFEEYEEIELVEEMQKKILGFSQAAQEEKGSLAKRLVESVSV